MLGVAGTLALLLVAWILSRAIQIYFVASSLPKLRGPPPASFWTGNLKQWFSREADAFQKHVALDFGPVVKLRGMIGWPVLYVSDPKALHTILVKEEPSYLHRWELMEGNRLMFGSGVFSTLGSEHSRQRKLLNPVFSPSHLKHMLPIFYDIANRLRVGMRTAIENEGAEQDVTNWMARAALEAIGQGSLGYSFDPLVEDSKDTYADAIKSFNPKMTRLSYQRRFIPYLSWLGPAPFRRLLARCMPEHWAAKEVYRTAQTIHARSAEVYASKKAALRAGGLRDGKDLMSVLMRANSATPCAGEHLSDDAVLGQMTTFVFGALDTTAAMLSRILQLLATHADVQDELRRELLEAHAAEGITYDCLDALPLLDNVLKETLRLYPPATQNSRVAQKDSVLPLSRPVTTTDGQTLREIFVPKGTEVLLGTYGSNVSRDVWGGDALEWKPQRWNALPLGVAEAHIPSVYAHLMTFGAGRRACIGLKFSEMELKVLLAVLVASFTFELTEKPIVWNVAGVRYPTVGWESNKAEMPMNVRIHRPE